MDIGERDGKTSDYPLSKEDMRKQSYNHEHNGFHQLASYLKSVSKQQNKFFIVICNRMRIERNLLRELVM
jgi:hypothetical protein